MRESCVALAQRFDRNRIAGRTERILQAVAEASLIPEVEW